jgi:hypothetical protein
VFHVFQVFVFQTLLGSILGSTIWDGQFWLKNYQNQLILYYKVIFALEIKVFKVWHMGFSNISILILFMSLVHYFSIIIIVLEDILRLFKNRLNYNNKFGLDLTFLTIFNFKYSFFLLQNVAQS